MAERTWEEMSLVRLRAAKVLLDSGFYRDSISRSYYAAYCAATSAVIDRNVTFAFGRQNPSHDQLPNLILNTGRLPKAVRQKVRMRLYFLRYTRENADYRPHAPIDRALALDCILNAAAVIKILEA
ncbi:MAG: HEPN domain-containing protein [Armatimonadota bacterium]|nr:HEPN domain-containing protein [Armatimonadota bacterium]